MFGAADTDGFQVDEGHAAPAPVVDGAIESPVTEGAEPQEAADEAQPVQADQVVEEVATTEAKLRERNADGTFKAADKPADATPAKSKKGNPRHDPDARIGAALREAREAREYAARLEGELTALRRGSEPAKPKAAPVDDDPAPKAEDYDDYAKFIEDKIAHGIRQGLKKHQADRDQQDRQTFTTRHHAQREKTYHERITARIQADPEFLSRISDDVDRLLVPTHRLENPNTRTVYNAIADEVLDAEHPDKLLEHLSAHADEFQRLATLQPRQLTRALAILDHSFAAAKPVPATAQTASVSTAKPPVRPVESAAPVSDQPPGEDASDDEHYAYYSRLMLNARRGGRR